MTINKRILTAMTILFFVMTMVFIYGHVNSLVSYKYEVQDYLNSGTELNEHQKQIIADIGSTETAYYVSGILCVLTTLLRLVRPTF